MPSWHTRLLAGSPTSKAAPNQFGSTQNGTKEGVDTCEDLEPRFSLPYGPLRYSSPQALTRPSHSRSHSHPSGLVPRQSHMVSADKISRCGPAATRQRPPLESTRNIENENKSEATSNSINATRPIERDLISGRCATCSSLVRWPRQLSVFRCAGCLMINDLKPRRQRVAHANPTDLGDIAGHDLPAIFKEGDETSSLSVPQTLRIIHDCLDYFIESRVSNKQSAHAPRWPLHEDASNTALPTTFGTNLNRTLAKSEADQNLTHKSRGIFADLEEYIDQCFNDVDCLNSSFLAPSPARTARAASESDTARSEVPQRSDRPAPVEVDGKTLLLGDFAENGMWWVGKPQSSLSVRHRRGDEGSAGSHDTVDTRSPRIIWEDVHRWYEVVLSLSRISRERLQQVWQHSSHTPQKTQGPQIRQKDLLHVYAELDESSLQVQRTLLKVIERLLRRPGRQLKGPSECRFLLIILANPLICDSERAAHPNVTRNRLESRRGKASHVNTINASGPETTSEPLASISRHSSILKRVFGIISNLSPHCHRCFVNWFSQYTETQLRKLVEMTSNFVTHRLLRLQGRIRPNNEDLIAKGLIPEIRGLGAGTSAQLHAAIGHSQTSKSSESTSLGTSYGEDWQLKAAAKVMLLLFTANNGDQLMFDEPLAPLTLDKRRPPAYLAEKWRMQRHAQALPINAFYNGFLDSCDLVSDFETWESRRAKFCFCQYPMFLSIWAKISILEHDTRRQMEIKAREAFFNSIISRKAISQYLVLKVRRECLVEDSLRTVSEVVGTGQEEIKKGLKIQFLGEDGLDSGGLRKEWFLLLVREIFDPEHGLFTYDEDSNYCYFNPHSFETSDQFFLVGVLLGLAIYNSTILDVALPPFAFRKLLASSPLHTGPSNLSTRGAYHCTLNDLAEYKPGLAHGLRKVLDYVGDVQETFGLDFVANIERFGQAHSFPLCPNGDHRPVTNTNRREYVKLYVKYVLDDAINRQFEPFKRGFYTVCGGNALSLFRSEEIELLIRGSDEPLDIGMIQAVATYDGWDTSIDPTKELTIVWFWEAFSEATAHMQRRLLSFITASDRIPAIGAASLVIKIVRAGDDMQKFPIARTCFNMIGIPRYPSKRHLESKLWKAVEEGGGFGMK